MVESTTVMNQTTTFYLVRHGETPYNAQKLIQGHLDIELNDNGINQAREVSKKLADVKFDNVFSSDLKRAHQTALQITAQRKHAEVITDELLREMYLGSYEGRKISDFHQELKELIEYRDSLPKEERFSHQVADIETDQSIIDRFIKFFKKTEPITKEKTNLIVTHGAAMRVLLIYFGWAEYEQLPHGNIQNTAYAVLEKNGDTFEIKNTFGIKKI